MRRQYGSLHLVPVGWDGSADDAGSHVVETYRYGPSDIKLAIELARLCGDEARARQIKEAMDRGLERDETVLDERDIRDLLTAIDGLEGLVRSRLLGSDGLIPLERVADLRACSSYMDLDELRGDTAVDAGMEAISRVGGLRDFLVSAQSRGMHVALD